MSTEVLGGTDEFEGCTGREELIAQAARMGRRGRDTAREKAGKPWESSA